ncbi:MAG: ABC transporter ATP-binding protein [Candidatus Sulfobium sp.]
MEQIALQGLAKDYILEGSRITAVQEVSLDIRKGDFICIVGHSGSGKTTLLSMLGCILKPSAGKVFFEGTDVYSLGEDALSEYRARKVGYVFQFASLLPALTAKENLLLPTLFSGMNGGGSAEKRAVDYMELVGLGDKVNAYPGQLSGGQQRRVAIARALMNDPSAILADEPTGDLDEETENEVMNLFKKINRENNITFILVTHSSELARAADRKIKMFQGHVEEIAIGA